MLRDEFVSGEDLEFKDDELDIYIQDCLQEISAKSPYKSVETLTTTANSRVLDISDIKNLMWIYKLEYPTGSDPRDYRNFIEIDSETIEIDITSTPAADEDVYIYCAKSHELTESVSTLNPQLAKLVVDGAVAKASLSWVNEMRGQIAAAISTATSAATAIGNMSARVTQAISDLTSGRALIATKHTESDTAIGNMSTRITQAIDDLSAGRALIGSKKTEAITALDAVADLITQAADDLTTGRAQIDDARTLADTAIDNMSDRITQAIADLTSGRSLINTVNIGTSPETDYSNYAGRELGIAVDYLNQAKGYLGEGATSDRYQAYAARDLQAAATYISQARGYLAIDTVTAEYGNYAARELSNANVYLNQARAFLAQDAKSTPYANYAAREVNNATTYLNQAGGYLRQLTSQLNIAKTISGYQTWGNNKLALFKEGVDNIPSAPRVSREYPTG